MSAAQRELTVPAEVPNTPGFGVCGEGGDAKVLVQPRKKHPVWMGWASELIAKRESSCSCRQLDYIARLRAFLALHDLELDVIPLLKAFVTFRVDGAVVNKNIGPVVPPDETEPLSIIEPFDFTFNPGHLPLPPYVVPMDCHESYRYLTPGIGAPILHVAAKAGMGNEGNISGMGWDGFCRWRTTVVK